MTPKLYHVGTLQYTRRGLYILFAWLLWGDFAFAFFESIFGRLMPLYLRELGASNTLIGLMTGSIAGLVNIFFLPNISQWNDRLHTSLGRRIPLLLVSTPLTVLSLVLIGFAPEIGGWMHGSFVARLFPSLSEGMFILGMMCGFVVSFHFFNMVLVNAYNWLLKEVVPGELMARFLSWFRIVSTLSGFLFLWYVFPCVLDCRKQVCIGIGIFYLFTFLMMCWKVKEGEHPILPEPDKKRNVFGNFLFYFRDSYRVPLYWHFFAAYTLLTAATVSAAPFMALFAKETIGLGMSDMGKVWAWAALVSVFVYFPVGWLCDRFHPIYVITVGLVLFLVNTPLAYFWVHDKTDWLVYSIVNMVPTVAWNLGVIALSMKLFHPEKFGQFSSGLNVFGCGGLIIGNLLAGELLDLAGSNYRLAFFWTTSLVFIALYPMARLYQEWRKMGGRSHYVAPLPPAE